MNHIGEIRQISMWSGGKEAAAHGMGAVIIARNGVLIEPMALIALQTRKRVVCVASPRRGRGLQLHD